MQIVITPKALKQFQKLTTVDKTKIKRKLAVLEENPFEGKKLKGQLSEIYSLKAWPYRILYYIDDKPNKVYVVTIAHRQGVYE